MRAIRLADAALAIAIAGSIAALVLARGRAVPAREALAPEKRRASTEAPKASTSPRPSPRDDGARAIGPEGGRIDSNEAGLEGVSVVVPPGALNAPETIRIARALVPGPFPKEMTAASLVVALTKESPSTFERAVLVTLPLASLLREGDVPSAFYWDTASERWRGLTLVSLDDSGRSATFATIHFTDFALATTRGLAREVTLAEAKVPDTGGGLPGSSAPTPPGVRVLTGFDPALDGFPYLNRGERGDPGDCMGFSRFVVAYFERRRSSQPQGTTGVMLERAGAGSPHLAQSPWVDAPSTHATLEKLEFATPGFDCAPIADRKAQVREGLDLIQRMQATGSPQVLVLGTAKDGKGSATTLEHAVVAYGYEAGHFLICDPNHAGDVMTLDFDSVNGFGKSLVNKTPDGTVDPFETNLTGIHGVNPSDDISFREIERLEREASSPASLAGYATVAVDPTAKEIGGGGNFGDRGYVLHGRVTGSADTLAGAKSVGAFGEDVLGHEVFLAGASLGPDGSFEIRLDGYALAKLPPTSPIPIRVVALASAEGAFPLGYRGSGTVDVFALPRGDPAESASEGFTGRLGRSVAPRVRRP